MNYWPVETANLSELHQPLLQFLHDTLRVTGAHTALTHYGARGFVAHHNTDIWGLSNPVGNHGRGTGSYAYWPLSAGWLCSHAFEHYLFTQDKDFLRETGYPHHPGRRRFFLDVLIENADGKLIFSPSTSPENVFIYNGKRCSVAETTTHDHGHRPGDPGKTWPPAARFWTPTPTWPRKSTPLWSACPSLRLAPGASCWSGTRSWRRPSPSTATPPTCTPCIPPT